MIHSRWVNFMACKLFFNRVIKKGGGSREGRAEGGRKVGALGRLKMGGICRESHLIFPWRMAWAGYENAWGLS